MKPSRKKIWLALSLICLTAALIIWRHHGPSSAGNSAPQASANLGQTPSAATTATAAQTKFVSASTAPFTLLTLNKDTNASIAGAALKREQRLKYRLSNTTETVGQLARNPKAVLLENALIDSTRPLDFTIPDSLKSAGDPGTYIVQSRLPINDQFRSRLLSAGATIISYIPNNAYLVRMSAGEAQRLSGFAQAVIPFEPYYKLDLNLLKQTLEGRAVNPSVNVLVFADAREATLAALNQLGIVPVSESRSPFGPQMVLENAKDVAALARIPGIQRVEAHSVRRLANDLTRAFVQVSTNSVTTNNYLDLTGRGVTVDLNDSGADATHPDLLNRVFSTIGNPQFLLDLNGHGTHVAGIIAGDGTESLTVTNAAGSIMPGTNFQFRGKAPAANLFVMPAIGGMSDYELQQAAARTNALISNNSWGYGNQGYDIASASFDAAVRDSLPEQTGSQPVLYVFSAGNGGNGDDDGLNGSPESIESPSTAKNVITVGAIELPRGITNEVMKITAGVTNISTPWLGMTDSSNQLAGFSARGNVGIGIEGDFGRFKPDVVAPGTFVVSTRSQNWDELAYYNPTNYSYTTYQNKVVTTNGLLLFPAVLVPDNAVQLVIQATATAPVVNLPIYVKENDVPTTADFLGNNRVSLPPDAPLVTGTIYYFSVGDPTNLPVTFDLQVTVITTNDLGNYFEVLSNLNNSIGEPEWYRYETGTSMAAPVVSGVLALMQEFFQSRQITNSPALMKALIINGARAVSGVYDFQVQNTINYQGWGLINLTNSLPTAFTNQPVIVGPPINTALPMLMYDQSPTNALSTGDSRTINIKVDSAAASQPLRLTLVWTDPPGNPAAGIKLVNNLDLVVTNLDNPANPLVYFGNDIQAAADFNNQWDTNGLPNRDLVNNVENIYLAPTLGTNYSVTVIARSVNVNAVTAQTNAIVQDYALVISSGDGQVATGLQIVQDVGIFSPNYTNLTVMTNQFGTNNPNIFGQVLGNQRSGANSPLIGTNGVPSTIANGEITLGETNQWHFYIITNTTSFTNAVFATSLPVNLASSRMGVTNTLFTDEAARLQADIDLYETTDPLLLTLDSNAVAHANQSLGRGGFETIILSNAVQNQIYYIGVKSEDHLASEYTLTVLFSLFPFNNGDNTYQGYPLPAIIPDGTPALPGAVAVTSYAVASGNIKVRRVVVTNLITHENFGDLIGTLSHDGAKPVVLDNHTFGNSLLQQQSIYEDSGANSIPGSKHSDGPGSLANFIGDSVSGQWSLVMVDNALTHTGRVDDLTVHLDPHVENDLPSGATNGVILTNCITVAAHGLEYDFVHVPFNGSSIQICVSNSLPVQLYVRNGALPTPATYDYTKAIPAGGGCLTVSLADLPPLQPGTLFFAIGNSNAVPVDVCYEVSLTISLAAITTANFNSTNKPSILDDAVSYSSISITNDRTIASAAVGVVLDHPRVSDLAMTLISPAGERYLLFENRGGLNATNIGHLNITTNFFGTTTAGNAAANTNTIGPIPTSGILVIDYEFFTVPDTLDVFYDGVNIFSTGLINGNGTLNIPYGPGIANSIDIVMNRGNNPRNTAWTYTPAVINQDFAYLTFTEDPTKTKTPIKFGVPPYDLANVGTNYVLSDFELAASGEYLATSTTTNIPDSLGGWTMRTNDVVVGTNLISMASNQVSVVTDPSIAYQVGTNFIGSNYLALANGTISRTVLTTPGKQYTISYRYRGPGIAGWYRGEGNATDSSDPETEGNNGSFIGRFTFPQGEVSQAFQFEGTNGFISLVQAPDESYVQVREFSSAEPGLDSLDVGAGSGFTVEGWINPTNLAARAPLVEWLAPVLTNGVDTNLVIIAGPFLNQGTGHYYYMLNNTNWTRSEAWARQLGGHLVTINDANEQNWVYDTFSQFASTNRTLWIGLNDITNLGTFTWVSGQTNVFYTNWLSGQPLHCTGAERYVAMINATNSQAGLWTLKENDGRNFCPPPDTNRVIHGIVEVDEIRTNGVQLWVSVTNSLITGRGALYADIVDTNNVSHLIFSAPGLIQSNVYQHVALTYNTNSGIANLYYNGTNVASTNLGVFRPKTGGDLLLGKDMSRFTNNIYLGKMDEMSVYRRFLSPTEIAQIYRISAATNTLATNGNLGKFDSTITPAFGLAEAQVSIGGSTNVILAVNDSWQFRSLTFTATTNSIPVQITGLQPGILLDSFNVNEAAPGNLYYLPEESLADLVGQGTKGKWTLELQDLRAGATNFAAQVVSWQMQFIFQNTTPTAIPLAPFAPSTNTVQAGKTLYFTVDVPAWAIAATNILVSATSPVDLLFNQTNPPTGAGVGDFTLLNNSIAGNGVPDLVTNQVPLPALLPGRTYYLGVRNQSVNPVDVVVRVDFNITTLSNGVPVYGLFKTNETERYYAFDVSTNAYEATFQLLKMSSNVDLVVRQGIPLPTLLSSDFGSFNAGNLDENIYVLTNSLPVALSPGRWYLGVIKRDPLVATYTILAKELTSPITIIDLANGVPFNFTAGAGAALTNFFRFTVTNSAVAMRFELYNLTGNGDLTVQTNALPLSPPFRFSSQLPFQIPEVISIQTNSALTNLNAEWYVGVPNHETNLISYTIVALTETSNAFPAFPGAEGAGGGALGGRGGDVYHVNNLNDSGFGSLRDAVNSATTNRTVVFDVSGTIKLLSPLIISHSNLTIAGQTAPGEGITVSGALTSVENVHDVVIRYVRFRPATSATSSTVIWSNGFEGASGSPTAPSYFAGGWFVNPGDVDVIYSGVYGPGIPVAYSGTNFIDLNGVSPGTITTNVNTVAGQTYSLNFAFAQNPDGPINGVPTAAVNVLQNGALVAALSLTTSGYSWSNIGWSTTSVVFTATAPITQIQFASQTPGSYGVLLDAVSLTAKAAGDSLQFLNTTNVIADHVTTSLSMDSGLSALWSTNVTVQWSMIANNLNQSVSCSTNPVPNGLGSRLRFGNGALTFHHNLYANNSSASPRLGDNIKLDFVDNVVYNWGSLPGFSTNDLADNPLGFTNYLNYVCNYLVAGKDTATNMLATAFLGGTTNTWIYQTNNFIDSNTNGILDGANTQWQMFTNDFVPAFYSRTNLVFPELKLAIDETFLAYEKVLAFAGPSMDKRDSTDTKVVAGVRTQTDATRSAAFQPAGLVSWWPAECNANDIAGPNNGTLLGGVAFASGEVGQAFDFDGISGTINVPASASLNVGTGTGLTLECWIAPTSATAQVPLMEWRGSSGIINGSHFWISVSFGAVGGPGAIYANLVDTGGATHIFASPAGTVKPGILQHVALTYDKASGVGKMYYNGVLVATKALGTFTPKTNTALLLGRRMDGSNVYYKGLMDEAKMFSRALSQTEIQAIYNAENTGTSSAFVTLPFLDTDLDGAPDFWETTLGENPTNATASLVDRDGDGYTDLEEYMNWLAVPHALTLTNTLIGVDLVKMFGGTGNLSFSVTNGVNGLVYLTNILDSVTNVMAGITNVTAAVTNTGPYSNSFAIFMPTNSTSGGTNYYGYAAFDVYATNNDTIAYYGPVKVSVMVSAVPILYVPVNTNSPPILSTNLPDLVTNELTLLTVTNTATLVNTNLTLSYTVSLTIDTNAMNVNGWPLTYVTTTPFPVIDTNGIITWTPSENQGPGVYIITTVASDSSIPPLKTSNSFKVTVNEVNLAPFWPTNVPSQTNYTIAATTTLIVTNTAADADIPPNPLSYQLSAFPAGAVIDTNGIITWTPTVAQAPGVYTFTTIVTDTNVYALFNNSLSATNSFTVTVTLAAAPFVFTQPAQAVTGASAQLNGMVTPNGLPTTAWFQWGTNTSYGNITPVVNVSNSFNVVYTPSPIVGLLTNTPYHFRLVASNSVGITIGFDQILDEANVVPWGANYVGQLNVPAGLSNVVAIAGAYDHSLALKNNGTVTAWGDNTFGQTNVPSGLKNVLAVAGGEYYSMALTNNGTVIAWGANILSQITVPPGLNSVVTIAGGTFSSLALRNNGAVVVWGANFFGLTTVPANATNNAVAIAGGGFHNLAIKNNGTVIAWGDNSAGQLDVPLGLTNVVAVAGGNYHSLALRANGTVVAWGDNSSGQTNVPFGLNNVVAVAAGGFHSLALKSDGTLVTWGDNSSGQTTVPAGLSNVVAIASGYFHSLALTPLSLVNSTNPIILDLTNGVPQTNSILSGGIIYYRVHVPTNADFATNSLLFTQNGPLNIWFTTNTPPGITNLNDRLLLGGVTNGVSILSTTSAPTNIIPGTIYYLGVQNTNPVVVPFGIRVDFHLIPIVVPIINISSIIYTNIGGSNGFLLTWFAPSNYLFQVQWTPTLPTTNWNTFTNIISYNTNVFTSPTNTQFNFFDDGSQTGGFGPLRFYRLVLLANVIVPPPLTNGVPLTNSIAPGTVSYFRVNVPTNADFSTNILLFATNSPVNVWFTTNSPPSVTNANDTLLLPVATNGTYVLGTNTSPRLVPGSFYYLAVQNTNSLAVGYALRVDFHLFTNAVPIITINSLTSTNIGGTNGFLLTWFAPTNAVFQVQWSPSLVPTNWQAFAGVVTYTGPVTNSNGLFTYFDNGVQFPFGPSRYYRVVRLTGNTAPVLPPVSPVFFINPQATLNVTNTATDVDLPPNILAYVLSSTVTGTNNLPTITTNIGVITWTPSLVQAGTSNVFTTVVTDNGVPPLSATNSFVVIVNPVPVISSVSFTTNGYFQLNWFAPTNNYFLVESATSLIPPVVWTTNGTFVYPFASNYFRFIDSNSIGGLKFFRLLMFP